MIDSVPTAPHPPGRRRKPRPPASALEAAHTGPHTTGPALEACYQFML